MFPIFYLETIYGSARFDKCLSKVRRLYLCIINHIVLHTTQKILCFEELLTSLRRTYKYNLIRRDNLDTFFLILR